MRDIYVCVIFLRVKIYWMFFYWSHFFDIHFSYCEVFMCQVFPDTFTRCSMVSYIFAVTFCHFNIQCNRGLRSMSLLDDSVLSRFVCLQNGAL